MPIGNYQWKAQRAHLKDNPKLQKQWLNTIIQTKADASRGYFVNINGHFPKSTYDYLRDLPLQLIKLL